jgi:dipeptidyl aminopeptidase/acylaminoacyl peptidase
MIIHGCARRPLAALLLLSSTASFAQGQTALTAADYARAERFMPYKTAPLVTHTVESINWQVDGSFWYRTTTSAGSEFLWVDPVRRTRGSAFDQQRLAANLSASAGTRFDATNLPFRTFELSGDHNKISFDASSKRWTCELRAGMCSQVSVAEAVGPISPDGRLAAFVRGSNLWVRTIATGQERQLTLDGVKDFGYATDNAGWKHSGLAVVTWSPDSKKLATFQLDERGVGEMYLVSTRLGHPDLESWKYPMAGDATVATIQRVIVDVASATVLRLRMAPDAHRSSPCYDVQCGDGAFADVQWSADASTLAFLSSSRDHKQVQLRIADAMSGDIREVLSEQTDTFYESDISSTVRGAVNWRYLPASHEIIWFSQRDDHAHLYLYDSTSGGVKAKITVGDWNVVEILKIDVKARVLYLVGVGKEKGRDPYYRHLYKVGFDGSSLKLLTPEDANHEISMAPSGRYFVDSYSTPQTPPVTVLRDHDGALIATLESGDISQLLASGWKAPISITVKARDGITDLYGLMFRPTAFVEGRKYPLIDWIYPGPQIGSVGSRSFAAARGDRQALAELGFVVVAIDGRGTPFRSKKFHDAYYGDLLDSTLPDQVAGIKQLAERYGGIDLERIGIYGHSGGGYAAAAAMLLYPDFFKVGVSESGNHDQRAYTDDWGEKFLGLMHRNHDGGTNYDGQGTEEFAKNLKGHLLLAHGTLDDNVPPYATLLLADSLIKANKDFDMIMLPNQRHTYGADASAYMTRKRWDYFVRYLIGVEPPHEYEMRAHAPESAVAQ